MQRIIEQRVEVPTAGGASFRARLVRPEAPNGRGLVLLHTMFGINDMFRGFCREYADQGYSVLAPDLFWRFGETVDLDYSPENYQKGHGYVERLQMELSLEDVAASIRYLRRFDPPSAKVGLVGYCMGGSVAVAAATDAMGDFAVSYYPLMVKERLADYSSIRTPTVIHIGSEDRYVPADLLGALQDACRGQPHVQVHVYPGAAHGFANRRAASPYDEAAADLAWFRTVAALRGGMGS